MSNNDDLWDHLNRAGIFSCDERTGVEIDRHKELTIKKSYFFDCLRFDDGSEFIDVTVTIDWEGNCSIDCYEIILSESVGMRANSVMQLLNDRLIQNLRTFLADRGELE